MMSSMTKIDNYVIITSLKSETTCKMINRIPGLCLLISSLPGFCLVNLISKDTHLVLYFFYYIPIKDTSFELSVFWLSDTESRIKE